MTTKAYKLLNPDLTTHGGYQWVVGETKRTSGEGDLCGPGWLHGYEHAELAHFLNPIHVNFTNPVLYEVRVGGKHLKDGSLKSGWTKMTLIALTDVTIPTTEQRVRFAIACALSAGVSPSFRQWAYNWLDGVDRTAAVAAEAAAEAAAAARAATEAAATEAAWAARAATEAATEAAWAAAWAAARAAARAAEVATWAAARAAAARAATEAVTEAVTEAAAAVRAAAARAAEARAAAARAAEAATEAAWAAARAAAWAAAKAVRAAAWAAEAESTMLLNAARFAMSERKRP